MPHFRITQPPHRRCLKRQALTAQRPTFNAKRQSVVAATPRTSFTPSWNLCAFPPVPRGAHHALYYPPGMSETSLHNQSDYLLFIAVTLAVLRGSGVRPAPVARGNATAVADLKAGRRAGPRHRLVSGTMGGQRGARENRGTGQRGSRRLTRMNWSTRVIGGSRPRRRPDDPVYQHILELERDWTRILNPAAHDIYTMRLRRARWEAHLPSRTPIPTTITTAGRLMSMEAGRRDRRNLHRGGCGTRQGARRAGEFRHGDRDR